MCKPFWAVDVGTAGVLLSWRVANMAVVVDVIIRVAIGVQVVVG